MYFYKIKEFLRIYDGDTVTVIIDLGFGVTKTEKIRLSNINAPELKGKERKKGLLSRDFLIETIKKALEEKKDIFVKTRYKGKYGRYIGEIFIGDLSVNNLLIEKGYAVPYI